MTLDDGSISAETDGVDTENSDSEQQGPQTIERKPPSSFWQRLRKKLWPSKEDRRERIEQRLYVLTSAIEIYPETPTNYVLRGELYLEAGAYELAINDFEQALGLSVQQLEEQSWGVIAQAMQDRAHVGLDTARRLAEGHHQDEASDHKTGE